LLTAAEPDADGAEHELQLPEAEVRHSDNTSTHASTRTRNMRFRHSREHITNMLHVLTQALA
jgi:hypothetical protein